MSQFFCRGLRFSSQHLVTPAPAMLSFGLHGHLRCCAHSPTQTQIYTYLKWSIFKKQNKHFCIIKLIIDVMYTVLPLGTRKALLSALFLSSELWVKSPYYLIHTVDRNLLFFSYLSHPATQPREAAGSCHTFVSWKQVAAPRRNTDIPEDLSQLMVEGNLNKGKDVPHSLPENSTLE